MNNFKQQFIAHPVGQGLFYSGNVKVGPVLHDPIVREFNFVFDCGSLTKTNAIDAAKAVEKSDRYYCSLTKANAIDEVNHYRSIYLKSGVDLDLLVISHFDADHVNCIKDLLKDRKVRHVVLPFTTLAERLFLAFQYIDQSDPEGSNSEPKGPNNGPSGSMDDSIIDFIIDPIGGLNEFLNDDSVIYLVKSGKDPFAPPEKTFPKGIEPVNSDSSLNLLDFYVNASEIEFSDLTGSFYNGKSAKGKIKTFDDSKKTFLGYSPKFMPLMEFLFYRRDLGKDSDDFFNDIFDLFCSKYGCKSSEDCLININCLIEKVKGIKSSKEIKKIIKEVSDRYEKIKVKGHGLLNLNTTALSMLHYNIFNELMTRDLIRFHHIKRFDGSNSTRLEELCDRPCICPEVELVARYNRYPNCLLTSDSYLKTEEEVEAFYYKYQNYADCFWLFQIPHHGSTYSAGLALLARLPNRLFKFINYGTTHRFVKKWSHPSSQLILDLIESGQSTFVLPINEFSGLQYDCEGFIAPLF